MLLTAFITMPTDGAFEGRKRRGEWDRDWTEKFIYMCVIMYVNAIC